MRQNSTCNNRSELESAYPSTGLCYSGTQSSTVFVPELHGRARVARSHFKHAATLIMPDMSEASSEEAGPAEKYTAEQLRELWSSYMIEGARYGDSEDVVEALGNNADVNATDEDGRSALHMAAANGHTGIMQTLLDAGANTEQRNATGNTALHWACVGGSVVAVQLLLDGGADACALNDAEKTPLDGALESESILKIFQNHSRVGSAADKASDASSGAGNGEASRNELTLHDSDHHAAKAATGSEAGHDRKDSAAAVPQRGADEAGAGAPPADAGVLQESDTERSGCAGNGHVSGSSIKLQNHGANGGEMVRSEKEYSGTCAHKYVALEWDVGESVRLSWQLQELTVQERA